MITTILMDYDSTLHDMDGVMEITLDGLLGMRGKEFHRIWVYEIHRNLIHEKFLDRHDDVMFHCELLFDYLGKPINIETAETICRKFDEARQQAKNEPTYYTDVLPALDMLKERGYTICLSTGYSAKEKAATLESKTGKEYFEYIFSESSLGVLKTEPEFYKKALEITGSIPEETVSVGDTPLSDIRPAKLIGVHTIWVNRINESKPLYSDQIAEYEVTNLLEAVDIISQL
jgi:putative hydrolase of the HAD superfamily